MTDFWSFLLQTLTASGVAALLLVIKALFRDKLSPRWQFAVWGILAGALLIPAGFRGRYVLLNWPLLVETLKSALTGRFGTLTRVIVPVPLPVFSMPRTLWDWLYLAYAGGVLLLLARYAAAYVRLRKLLKQGSPVAENREMTAENEKLKAVGEKYGLSLCPAVKVEGLSSAFVCGVFRPVLALPAGVETEEKVLLHELLHLKYRDAAWGLAICFFRCLHWCNPLLWHCANLAGNDLEALCDWRVLERLEGEERRDYGRILLEMTDEKYANLPGTSSMANGGGNIRRRIEAIARFKLYPAGMGLVSVCVALVLICPLLVGARAEELTSSSNPYVRMASARTTWCTSCAGAFDTYAKAVIADRADYRAMCAPLSEQDELAGRWGLPLAVGTGSYLPEGAADSGETKSWQPEGVLPAGGTGSYLPEGAADSGEMGSWQPEGASPAVGTGSYLPEGAADSGEMGSWQPEGTMLTGGTGSWLDQGISWKDRVDRSEGYQIYNLTQTEEGWEGLLVLSLRVPPEGETWSGRDADRWMLVQPLLAQKEEGRWVIFSQGEPQAVQGDVRDGGNLGLPAWEYEARTGDFVLRARWQTVSNVNGYGEVSWFGLSDFDSVPIPDGNFTSWFYQILTAEYMGTEEGKKNYQSIGISCKPLWGEEDWPELPALRGTGGGGGSSDGEGWSSQDLEGNWENTIFLTGGGSSRETPINPPDRYAAEFYLNGEKVGELTLLPAGLASLPVWDDGERAGERVVERPVGQVSLPILDDEERAGEQVVEWPAGLASSSWKGGGADGR